MPNKMKKLEICVFCCKPSTFYCNRCLDPYCSNDCQLKDWNNHRQICFPLPKLMPILRENECDDSRLLIGKQLEEIEHKKTDLDKTGFTEVSFGQYETIGSAEEMIEQGDVTNKTVEFDDTITAIINGAKDINLEQSDDSEKTKYSKGDDSGIDRTGSDIAIKQQDTAIYSTSQLRNLESEELREITEEIIENDKNEPLNNDDFKKHLMMKDLKVHEWPKSKNIKVKLQHVIQPPNIISFVEDKKTIDDFYQFMELEIEKNRPKIANELHSYLPKKNEIVLGHYGGAWYRACAIDPDPKGVIVIFIDYGNMELLTIDEILPIQSDSMMTKLSFEVCSRQFIVDNVPEELDEKQQEILESTTMMITNIHLDEKGIYHCEIFGF